MPRPAFLITVFVVSFLAFVAWMAPAQLLVGRLGAIPLGSGQLQLTQPAGRVWDGRVDWRWQRLSGTLDWALEWRGLTPGLRLELGESGDRFSLDGWVGSRRGSVLRARELDLKIPLATVTERFPRGSADGYISGRLAQLSWTGEAFSALSGELRYSGGQVRWGTDGAARVPPLKGRLYMEDGQARGRVTGPDEQLLAEAGIGQGEAKLRVFRAWPALLGVSGGGSAEDVVFEASRPFSPSGGER